YLNEFCFRFSRRSFGPALLDHLVLAIGASCRLN
ncbi:MAG: IS1595 family transposase, partial [Oscillibacter sp.]|nr:IS1595 family transposase [Oscillibacter sp.]